MLKKMAVLLVVILSSGFGPVRVQAEKLAAFSDFVYPDMFLIHEGKKLFTVTNPDKPVPFDEEDKKAEIESYKYNKTWKRVYETRKSLFRWPDYWPPLRTFFLDPADKKIYLQTYEAKEDKLKYIVYDFKGRYIKKCLLPYQGRMLFNGGKFYQLLENEETETWELHVNDID